MRFHAIAAAIVTGLVLLTAPAPAAAQAAPHGPDLAAQRAAMERLAPMLGNWRGEANVVFPAPRVVYQNERVERDMNGLLLVIHGAGHATADRAGAPIFNAFGVISYDDARQLYEFRVYNDGRAATAEARFLDDGRLQWTMNFSPVIIRYTITFDDQSWREVGEMSRDNGATWTPTIVMNLARVP